MDFNIEYVREYVRENELKNAENKYKINHVIKYNVNIREFSRPLACAKLRSK